MEYYFSEQSFDSFVVGHSNELAAKCARAIAENPGTLCNSLTFCGKTGTGKTHLMRAIEKYINEHEPARKTKYVTTRHFTDRIIVCVRNHSCVETINEMVKEYGSLDLLMIDDIQEISYKEATQDLIMDILEDLPNKIQIVFSADRTPQRIEGLSRQLCSRIQRGVVAEISAPDYEVRKGIMEHWLTKLNIDVPQSLKDDILKKKCNAFEMEGIVKRLYLMSRNSDNLCG